MNMHGFDYPAHLAMMGERAKTPREPAAPTVISSFAGGGGSLTGYMMAGYRDLLAIEWDDNAVETLRLNWPELDIYHGDIAKISVEEVLKRTGLEVGELDTLDGSPPCQGFSTAGKRKLNDSRNQLFREYVRLLRGLKPKVFVMENVSGLVKGKMKLVFVEILKELKASGYRVSVRLLNAMYFHVPQSRQRLIFVGVREDFEIEPSHPKGEGLPIGIMSATSGVVPKTFTGDSVKNNKVYRSALTIRCGNKPFGTITNRMNRHGIHPNETRYFSIEEILRGSSFPDYYKFIGTPTHKTCQIGNSVPPLFMEAIARHIRNEILSRVDAFSIEPELIGKPKGGAYINEQ